MERRIFKIPELGLEIEPIIDITVTHKGSSFIYAHPKHFYYKIVKENLSEFYKDDLNPRKALNACLTLYHMADWHCNNREVRKKLWEKMPYSEALESIANGTKHSNTEKPYQAGYKDSSGPRKELIVSSGDKVIKLTLILKEIEKFWDTKIGEKPWDLNWGDNKI